MAVTDAGPTPETADPDEASRSVADLIELAYEYPDGSVALRGVSVSVRSGETLGLLGPNGSGKSTLIRLLAEGDPRRLSLSGPASDLRGRLLVPDRPVFQEWLSGRENGMALLELRGLRAGTAGSAMETWLDRFGLAEDAGRPVATYSSGMRRRLALAVAFAAAPELLLLDEPLAALDPGARDLLAEALEDSHAAGRSVVLSTHDPEFAEAHCGRVAFLSEGRCPAIDAPARLLESIGMNPRIEVRFRESRAPDPRSLRSPPASVWDVHWIDGAASLEVEDPRAALPDALVWLLSSDCEVLSVDVRTPSLREAFFELTGRRLEAASG